MSGLNQILVVDANQRRREALAFAFERAGCVVRGTGDALEALGLIDGWAPQVAVVSMQLKGLEAAALARALRRKRRRVELPLLMVGQERNLREKLTLFWHNHMPTQIGVVFHSEAAYSMNKLLRDQCKGNFRQLIHDVSLEPAMLYYLNGYLNVAGSPDENYARELMELFTLGQGSGYTESDVQAAARVLTGWSVLEESGGDPILPEPVFLFFLHDQEDKQFSAFFNNTVITGQSGAGAGEAELNALLDMIMANDESSRFICREIYRFFVHG